MKNWVYIKQAFTKEIRLHTRKNRNRQKKVLDKNLSKQYTKQADSRSTAPEKAEVP